MIIGIPKEIKQGETRVGMLPEGVRKLVKADHNVSVQRGLGEKIGIPDREYARAGAIVFREPASIWESSDLIVKVKEPLPEEFEFIQRNQTIFTYLHLAPVPELVDVLLGKEVTAIDYGTVQREGGSMPLQYPMSDIAGILAVDIGAQYLRAEKKVLLDEVSDTCGRVVIIGAGVVGTASAQSAIARGAEVDVFDIDWRNLTLLRGSTSGRRVADIHLISGNNTEGLEETIAQTDLLIGATLVPGALAKHVVTKEMVKAMEPGSVIVDVSIDQGGCIETSRLTSHEEPIFWGPNEIIHYCVPNMPAMVGRTASRALTSATLPFVEEMTRKGVGTALVENDALASGVNLYRGCVTNLALAKSQNRHFSPLLEII